jgi:hypothetical protein
MGVLRPARHTLFWPGAVALVLSVLVGVTLGPGRDTPALAQSAAGTPTPTPNSATIKRGGRDYQVRTFETETAPDGRTMRAGSLLVKFRPGVSPAVSAATHSLANGQPVESVGASAAVRVEVPRGRASQSLAAYSQRSDVEFAEPDYMVHALITPNDPRWADQWGLTRISAPAAWDISHSASSIAIAILDCGIYGASSSVSSPDGRPGHADVRDKVILEQNFSPSADADDFCNHGTHVAGIAAASTNNGLGVAGVGFDARLLNGKVLDDTGSGDQHELGRGASLPGERAERHRLCLVAGCGDRRRGRQRWVQRIALAGELRSRGGSRRDRPTRRRRPVFKLWSERAGRRAGRRYRLDQQHW